MPTFRLSAIAMAFIVSGAVHADSSSTKPASEITRTLNQSWLQRLPFEDQSSFEDARRGLIAPFTGVVTPKVAVGDTVLAGAPVATIEAMKMEATITAPISGRVSRLGVIGSQPVEGGDLIAVVE